jgi:hypothetical protein
MQDTHLKGEITLLKIEGNCQLCFFLLFLLHILVEDGETFFHWNFL